MRLSAFTVVDGFRPGEGGGRERFDEVLTLAEAAESAGLAALWVAEHHFHDGGICPSPAILLAAAAQRTKRIRLGVMVSVLPFHDPVELAEQYAMVDRLSRGRLNLGVGSGYIPVEFEGFGVDASRKREIFDHRFGVLLAALRGEPAAPERSESPARINVGPVQSPHPPIWVAAQRREAFPFIARGGHSIGLIPYATVDSVGQLGEEIAEYRAALPRGSAAQVAAAVHLYAGPHPDRARLALQRYLDRRRETHSTFYQKKVEREPSSSRAETIEAADLALLGDPASVARRLDLYRNAGVDELLGIFDFGGLPLDEVVASVSALGAAYHP